MSRPSAPITNRPPARSIHAAGHQQLEVHGLADHHTHVGPGDLFFATAAGPDGYDGHDYIEHARAAGACAVVASRPVRPRRGGRRSGAAAAANRADDDADDDSFPVIVVDGGEVFNEVVSRLAVVFYGASSSVGSSRVGMPPCICVCIDRYAACSTSTSLPPSGVVSK